VKKIFIYSFIALLLVSCSKENDFLYREKPHRPTLPYPEYQALAERVIQVRQFDHLLRESGGVDILWVIDNSGSMQSYQNDVIRHTDKFMNEFTSAGRIDWRMGLISSDESEEPYLGFAQYNNRFFDYTDPNPVATFQDAVNQLGTNGSYTEKFFGPSLKWMSSDQFVRPDAFLAIIMISDEPEQTDGLSAQTYFNELVNMKGGKSDLIKVYTAIAAKKGLQPPCSEGVIDDYVGSRWEEIKDLSGALAFSACSADFGSEMANVAQSIIAQLKAARILIPDQPKVDTIKVTFQGEVVPGGMKELGGKWYFDEKFNEIVFYEIMGTNDVDETVQVSYVIEDGLFLPEGFDMETSQNVQVLGKNDDENTFEGKVFN
jgi:hypothetical protein